jgi:hypothetical protein
MRKNFILSVFLLAAIAGSAQKKITVSTYLRQGGLYYSSQHITTYGVGIGAGAEIGYGKHWLGQAGFNCYWLNGNTFSNNLQVGYQKPGRWSPAVFGVANVHYGSHTEVLLSDGRRPSFPTISYGIRVAPLRFENRAGTVSLLEIGYGLGKYKASCFEVSLISVSFKTGNRNK